VASTKTLQLYPRVWRLTIGTFDLSQLRITFRVKSSLKPEPNTADIEVYNLSDDHRAQLEQANNPTMRLEVGYNGSTHQIFLGEVRTCFTAVEGPDRITKFSSGDGEQAVLGTRIKVTYGTQVQIDTCLSDIARALGVGVGNLESVAAKLKSRGLASIYPRGISLNGNAWRELVYICRSAGLEATVQDGALLIVEQGQALAGVAVRLASDSGLVGSPTADNDGTVNCVAKLIPELRPGVQVQLASLSANGVYRVYDAEYTGDSHGEDWQVSLGMQKLKNAYIPQEIEI
jgi:hypothetical protein